MGAEPRQIAIGTVIGTLIGVTGFFALGLSRYSAGDDAILALGWGVAALLAPIILGRMLDSVLWLPALRARVRAAAPEAPQTANEPDRTTGSSVDLAADDDLAAVTAGPADEPTAEPRAA